MSRRARLALGVALAMLLALGATAWALTPPPALRAEGRPATVVMDLRTDAFLVVVPAGEEN